MIQAEAIAPYLEIAAYRAPAREPNGGSALVFISNQTGMSQLWIHDAQGTRQLTDHHEPVNSFAWNPKGGTLVFMSDCGGDERWQPYHLTVATGAVRCLADDPMTVHMWGAFSPDGLHIAVSANDSAKDQLDLCLIEIASGAKRKIGSSMGHQEVLAFTPDGTRLLVKRTLGAASDQKLDFVDLASGARQPVLDVPHRVKFSAARVLKAGGGVAVCDFDGDRMSLWGFDAEGFCSGRLWGEDHYDLDGVTLLPDQSGAVIGINEDGYSRLKEIDFTSGAARDIALPIPAVAGSISLPGNGEALLCALNSTVQAPSIWEISRKDSAARLLLRGETGPLDGEAFIAPSLEKFASFDGLEVPYFLYTPRGDAPAEGWPTIFIIHGGPEAQWRPDFRADVQWMLAQGIAVVAPNVRGSTGYGRRYHGLDDREKRLDALADVAALRAHLVAAGTIDGARTGIFGRSYGGYMVMAALSETPDQWKFGVNFYGIGNFFTHLLATGPWARQMRVAEYGCPDTQAEMVRRISPVSQLGRVTAPLLLVHADRDPRVPPGESETIRSMMFGLGKRCDILRIAHEGHGFSRIENTRRVFSTLADFIAKEL